MSATDDGGWETVANVQFQTFPNEYSKSEELIESTEFSVKDELIDQDNIAVISDRPSQYMYGVDKTMKGAPKSHNSTKSLTPQISVIEDEKREQRIREESLKKQFISSEISERVSSPSSHASDEGFVDKTAEEEKDDAFLEKSDVDHDIYNPDHIEPPSVKTSEAKIAMEIRELKEREAELRAIREMRQKELLKQDVIFSEDDQGSMSSREVTDDYLASLTTITDEGNFSEYGDHVSSDKSSDGSNSRIMSPDLTNYGITTIHQRKIKVKPYQDEDVEDRPVYTIMQKESVIEREIRLAKEREEAYRREKGLIPKATKIPQTTKPHTEEKVTTKNSKSLTAVLIQQEIEEAQRKERELRESGLIKTVSENRTISKAKNVNVSQKREKNHVTKRLPSSVEQNSVKEEPKTIVKPLQKTSASKFTTLPSNTGNYPGKLTRSLSTNNLSAPIFNSSNVVRPRGLMQKFIASKGKITTPTFISSKPPTFSSAINGNIRPKTFQPSKKSPIANSDQGNASPMRVYKRTHATAEEKIQEELREMKEREEELKRHRAKTLGLSQQYLASAEEDDETEENENNTYLPEVHTLRSVLSHPNLLDCDQPISSSDSSNRRKSALIAQWEGRIQQTEKY